MTRTTTRRPSRARARITAICAILAAVASGVALFWTAQKVQMADANLRGLQDSILAEKNSIHVLHAEWDYLNRPDRLEALAHDHLNMVPPQAGEVVNSPAALPDAAAAAATEPARKTLMQPQPAVMTEPASSTPPAALPKNQADIPSAADKRSFQSLLDDLNKDDAGKEGAGKTP